MAKKKKSFFKYDRKRKANPGNRPTLTKKGRVESKEKRLLLT